MSPEIKAVIITNVPPPYRVPVWRLVAEAENIDLQLVFCAQPHIDTELVPQDYGFVSHFLTGRYVIKDKSFMHFDFGVWQVLNQLKPGVVITTGYIPTFLIAFAWAVLHGVPHIAMTDGTFNSEKSLTWLHRLVRRVVLKFSKAFVGASEGSRLLFQQYGVNNQRIHLSYLCADNTRFNCPPAVQPKDFIFCGRFIALKRPIFALEVAHQTALRLGRKVSIDFVGSGDLENQIRAYAQEISEWVDCRFLGYAAQADLPQRYADAKIFLFPSETDTWGVVANEACAAGLPVIVTPYAGVADELVADGENGFVCDLEVGLWADAAAKLLSDETLYRRFSQNSRDRVSMYTFENSAKGLLCAIRQVFV